MVSIINIHEVTPQVSLAIKQTYDECYKDINATTLKFLVGEPYYEQAISAMVTDGGVVIRYREFRNNSQFYIHVKKAEEDYKMCLVYIEGHNNRIVKFPLDMYWRRLDNYCIDTEAVMVSTIRRRFEDPDVIEVLDFSEISNTNLKKYEFFKEGLNISFLFKALPNLNDIILPKNLAGLTIGFANYKDAEITSASRKDVISRIKVFNLLRYTEKEVREYYTLLDFPTVEECFKLCRENTITLTELEILMKRIFMVNNDIIENRESMLNNKED